MHDQRSRGCIVHAANAALIGALDELGQCDGDVCGRVEEMGVKGKGR